MSLTKSQPAFDRMMEEVRKDDDNIRQEYLEARYWEKRYIATIKKEQTETNKPTTDERRK